MPISRAHGLSTPRPSAQRAPAIGSRLPLPAGVSVVADAPDPQAPTALARPIVINETYVNTNSEFTDGIDVDARAKVDLPWDVKWVSEINFTDIFNFTYDNDGTTLQFVGTQAPYALSSGAGTPKYRAA